MHKDKGFIDIIKTVSQFPEVKKLISKKAKLTKDVKKIRRKLRTIKKEYYFLKSFIETESNNDFELLTKKYFKKIGYKKVIHTGKDTNREDIQIWYKKRVYIVECRKKETGNASRDDIGQLEWRKILLKDLPEFNGYKLFFIMVMNHQSNFKPETRRENVLSIDIEKALNENKNGFVTALELYNAFIKYKKGDLSFSKFDKILRNKGFIKF